MTPSHQRQYAVRNASLENRDHITSLNLETVAIPPIGPNEVLIRIHAVSLNFRDIMIATGTSPWPVHDGIVPCSDGAGEILTIGGAVTRFTPGQRVIATFHHSHLSGKLTPEHIKSGLGSELNGMLREYGVFHEDGLVAIPDYLSMEEASTLPCAGVTAWNALMGGGQRLQAGETVVVPGTGGVSLFALQFAVAAGANVIATTSSEAKSTLLRNLGAEHVVNYRETPEWGPEVKRLANDGQGADFVIEIAGPETIAQSLQSIRFEGVVVVIGQRSGQAGGQGTHQLLLADAVKAPCTIRRIIVGSRDQVEEMTRFLEVHRIRPVVDSKIFAFEDAPEALDYIWKQKHVGNVVIRIATET